MSMCFQLMLDEIWAKVDWVTNKCGLSKRADADTDTKNDLEGSTDDASSSVQLNRSLSLVKSSTKTSFRTSMTRSKTNTRIKRSASTLSYAKGTPRR